MKQGALFGGVPVENDNSSWIGHQLNLKFSGPDSGKVSLFHRDTLIKSIDLSDRVARKLLIVEAVELGAVQSRLASVLGISRQTIHNYLEIKKYFGIEGLVHNYSPSVSKSRRKQRQDHAHRRGTGNKARQVEQIRKEQRDKLPTQTELTFGGQIPNIAPEDQPFAELEGYPVCRHIYLFNYLNHSKPVAIFDNGIFR